MTHNEIFSFHKHEPIVLDKPFCFGVTGLNHTHINPMCTGLIEAGATLTHVYEQDEKLLEAFLKKHPTVSVCKSLDELLSIPTLELIATAAIPSDRSKIEILSMKAGKDVFTDKAPFLTKEELSEVKRTSLETGRKLFVYYGEFMHNEAAIFAKQLIDRDIIGKVAHIDIFAPHRLNAPYRPGWFFERDKTSGILTDIGSHQFQQFLEYAGTNRATLNSARVANYFSPEYEGFDDFGDATLTADNGITGYVRIDWMSPKGINTWGDGRVIILGSKGYIELRKNCNIGTEAVITNSVYVCTEDGVFTESVSGKVGYPFFTNLMKDVRNRTYTAMNEEQVYNAIELAITAQEIGMKK